MRAPLNMDSVIFWRSTGGFLNTLLQRFTMQVYPLQLTEDELNYILYADRGNWSKAGVELKELEHRYASRAAVAHPWNTLFSPLKYATYHEGNAYKTP